MPSFIQTLDCHVAQEKLETLLVLLNAFLPQADIPNLDHLQGVYICADHQKEQVINTMLRMGKNTGTYEAGTETDAFAVPIETDTELWCFVVFTQSFANKITSQNPFAAEIVLPLLEELLHVRLYSLLWQEQ